MLSTAAGRLAAGLKIDAPVASAADVWTRLDYSARVIASPAAGIMGWPKRFSNAEDFGAASADIACVPIRKYVRRLVCAHIFAGGVPTELLLARTPSASREGEADQSGGAVVGPGHIFRVFIPEGGANRLGRPFLHDITERAFRRARGRECLSI